MTKALFLTICLLTAANFSVAATSITGTPSSPTPSADPLGIINNLYQFTLLIGGLLAFGAIVYGGIKYILAAGNPSGQTEGREWIKSALLGLLLLMGAYLVLNTISPNLTRLSLPALEKIKAPEQVIFYGMAEIPPGRTGTTVSLETDARNILSATGISVNAQPPQTILAGINRETLDAVVRLKQTCNCAVVVTAGKESTGGHAVGGYSHASGFKIDIRRNAQLDNFIQNNAAYVGIRPNDRAVMFRSSSGAIYAMEGDHWDVLVVP